MPLYHLPVKIGHDFISKSYMNGNNKLISSNNYNWKSNNQKSNTSYIFIYQFTIFQNT